MLKKRLLPIIALFVTFSLVTSHLVVHATSIAELEKQQEQLNEESSEVSDGISNIREKLSTVIRDKSDTEDDIVSIDKQIGTTKTKIDEIVAEIETLEEGITALNNEIEDLEEQLARRDEIIRNRLVATQDNGGSSRYMEVVFGAKTFAQFIERFSAANKLVQADQDIFDEQKRDQERLEAAKDELEGKLAEQNALKEEHEGMMADLEKQQKAKKKLLKELEVIEEEHQEELDALEKEQIRLANESEAVGRYIADEKRKAEAARRQAEEEARKQQNNNADSTSSGSGSGSSGTGTSGGSGSSSGSSSNQVAKNGLFINPSAGVLTSRFGMRWGRMHYGIDIAKGGTVPIYAAADGYVTVSMYSPSYGEMIIIQHVLDGKMYATLYSHMRSGSRSVGVGTVVSQGQQIGLMGNTGHSYGQHLHFEIAIPTWGNRANNVDPLPYVNY